MYIVYHKHRKLDTGSSYKTFFFFFQVRNSVFLPQVLYRKSRGRDQEYMPGFSFKLHGCKTLKNSFSLHIDAV